MTEDEHAFQAYSTIAEQINKEDARINERVFQSMVDCLPLSANLNCFYIKASLTGDENDYIFDYKKRHDDFPHETTLDQMFTEQQFEAYRALGFHAAFGLFDRSDNLAHLDPVTNADVRRQMAGPRSTLPAHLLQDR
jgi:hypothetical protein